MAETQYYGTGRRKTAAARVFLTSGKGNITINDRTIEAYFGREVARMIVRQPFEVVDLVDFVAGVPGGTGEIFDWSLIPADLSKPLILAGGLTCENVQQALAEVRPFAVDVSGGVELSKGIKDAASVREFVRLVRASM